ncbi:hypothetical protein Mapa_015374 [Marchantia paleacea]|nr:hypothetical protein Mapa_015374 [Marchantia paleacea]
MCTLLTQSDALCLSVKVQHFDFLAIDLDFSDHFSTLTVSQLPSLDREQQHAQSVVLLIVKKVLIRHRLSTFSSTTSMAALRLIYVTELHRK